MLNTLVTVGDWLADSEGEYGFTISDRGLSGLSDGVAVKRDEVKRAGAHGSHDAPVYLDSRIVSVGGKCWARSPQELHQYGVILRGLGATGDRFKVVFRHAGETMWAWARRGSQPLFDDQPALGFADWQYDFWLPNPRLYGELRQFTSTGTSVTAHHRGNFPATPVFDVTGNYPGGYRLRRLDTGQTFNVSRPLTSGTHRVDFHSHTVSVGGAVQMNAVARPEVWEIPGGAVVPWQISPLTTGSGEAVMSLHDTFV